MRLLLSLILLFCFSAEAKRLTYEGMHNLKLDGKKFTDTATNQYLLIGRKYRDLSELTGIDHDLTDLQWKYETLQLIGSSTINASILIALYMLINSRKLQAYAPVAGLAGVGVGFHYWSMQVLKEYTDQYNLIHDPPQADELTRLQLNYSWNF